MPHRPAVHLRNRAIEDRAEEINGYRHHITGKRAYGVVNDTDDEATAGTGCDVLIICKLLPRDLETITARARIVINALFLVPAHIFDLDLVVVRAHRERTNERLQVDPSLSVSQPGWL